jgi:hypothetical protein
MNPLLLLGLGAAAMYYLDPEQGPRRRAQAREQLNKAGSILRERAYGAARQPREPGYPFPPEEEAAEPPRTPEGAGHLGR